MTAPTGGSATHGKVKHIVKELHIVFVLVKVGFIFVAVFVVVFVSVSETETTVGKRTGRLGSSGRMKVGGEGLIGGGDFLKLFGRRWVSDVFIGVVLKLH